MVGYDRDHEDIAIVVTSIVAVKDNNDNGCIYSFWVLFATFSTKMPSVKHFLPYLIHNPAGHLTELVESSAPMCPDP